MATNNDTPFPPPNLPIANEDGTPERNWYDLLLKLFDRTGGAQPPSNVDDLLTLVYETQAQAEAQAASSHATVLLDALRAMTELMDQQRHAQDVSTLLARLDDLERNLQESQNITALLRRLDELEGALTPSVDVSRYVERFIAGPVSAPNGTATTVHTLLSGAPAVWLVHGRFNFTSGDATNYGAFAVIVSDGNAARIALSNNAALMTISVSGLNVQIAQSSGGTQPVTASITKVG